MAETATSLSCIHCNHKSFTIINNAACCTKCSKQYPILEAEELERTRVQLAGCAVAANGGTSPPHAVSEGAYGWSPAYQDVLNLRRKYDSMLQRLQECAQNCQDPEVFDMLQKIKGPPG